MTVSTILPVDTIIIQTVRENLTDLNILLAQLNHTQTMDFPLSHVSLLLTLICRRFEPNLSDDPSSAHLKRADGVNNKASPTWRLRIHLKSSSELFFTSLIEMCLRRTLNHSGLVKRWTTVMEHKSISCEDMVGSWVEMITRTPKCRCCQITERSDSVRAFEPGVSVMYYTPSCLCSTKWGVRYQCGIKHTLCTSLIVMILPVVKPDPRYKSMLMLNNTHAIWASTKGHDRSMIVTLSVPKLKSWAELSRTRNDFKSFSHCCNGPSCALESLDDCKCGLNLM